MDRPAVQGMHNHFAGVFWVRIRSYSSGYCHPITIALFFQMVLQSRNCCSHRFSRIIWCFFCSKPALFNTKVSKCSKAGWGMGHIRLLRERRRSIFRIKSFIFVVQLVGATNIMVPIQMHQVLVAFPAKYLFQLHWFTALWNPSVSEAILNAFRIILRCLSFETCVFGRAPQKGPPKRGNATCPYGSSHKPFCRSRPGV